MKNQQTIDWTKPQRLSLFALISSSVLFMGYAMRFGWFLFIPLILDFSWEKLKVIALIIVIAMILAIISGIIYFLNFRFWLNDKEMIVQRWFFRLKRINIPYDRIQSVALEQSFWQQIMEVFQVKIDTAGSSIDEIRLRALSMENAQSLRKELQRRTNINVLSPDEEEGVLPESAMHPLKSTKKGKVLVKLNVGRLILVGLSENHLRSSTYIFAFTLYLYQYIEQFGLEKFAMRHIDETAFDFNSLTIWLNLLFLYVVISLLISLISTVFKYYNFRLRDYDKYLVSTHGLFKTSETHLKEKRIQRITLTQNPFQKLLDMAALQLTQVGVGTPNNSRAIDIPGMSTQKAQQWLNAYREDPSESEDAENIDIHPFRARYIWVRMLFFLIMALGIAIYFNSPMYNWPLSIVLVLLFILHYRSVTCYSVKLLKKGIQKQSAFFEKNTFFIKFEKIQHVSIIRGPISRLFGFYTLNISTAGGALSLSYLHKKEAMYLRDFFLFKVEKENKAWM
ncbi:MAG: PH domain-containing protein [Cyclobacteriaceae bacterium]|nr:PH domain-containing protein [Cyclobacteriaceae bacterium]